MESSEECPLERNGSFIDSRSKNGVTKELASPSPMLPLGGEGVAPKELTKRHPRLLALSANGAHWADAFCAVQLFRFGLELDPNMIWKPASEQRLGRQ